jgi:hypothetical protein
VSVYAYDNYPCSLEDAVIVNCPRKTREVDKTIFGVINYSVNGFCTNYDESSEEAFLKRVDAIIADYCSRIDKKKYDYVGFRFYDSCLNDCPEYDPNDPTSEPIFNDVVEDCYGKEILSCGVRFNENGKYSLSSDKIKSHPLKENGKRDVFYRDIEL